MIGWKLIKYIDAETFYKVCCILLFVAGIKLIYDGVLGKGWL